MNQRSTLAALFLCLVLSGCWGQKKVKAPGVPVAPQPTASAPVTPVPAPPAPVPAGSGETEPANAQPTQTPLQQPAPAPPQPAKAIPQPPVRRPRPSPFPPPPGGQAPIQPPTQAAPTQAPPTPAPAIRLGEILTDDRRRQYEADFARSQNEAHTMLTRATGRNLTAAQRQTVERIRTFAQQADEARSRDLATAVQLARRAELLAQDLSKEIQ